MPSLLRNTLEHALVRSKRTGDVEIRAVKGSSHRSPSSLAPHERILHYLGKERTHVCRCTNPRRHFEQTSCVASESRHLSADLTLYLERRGLESCAIADLWDYHEWQDAKWEMEGVYAGEFHYANRNKGVVCRCLQPWSHDYGTPRNPEIVEQCAEFFCVYNGELTATKKQWKHFDGGSPPTHSSAVQVRPNHLGSFQDIKKKHRSSVSPEIEVRSTAERMASFIPSHRRSASIPEPTSEPQLEMPPQVWKRARSSLWKAQPGAESAFSTPMGTVPPSRSTSPPVVPSMAQRATNSTSWSQVQREAGASEDKDSSDTPRARDWLAGSPFSTSSIRSAYENKAIRALLKRFPDAQVPKAQATKSVPRSYDDDNADLPISVSEAMTSVPISSNASEVYEEDDHGSANSRESTSNRRSTSSSRLSLFDNDLWYRDRLHYQTYGDMANQISVAELPACRSSVELPTTPARQRHTATLKELEGRDWDTASELEAKNSKIRHEQAISGTFNHARKTAGLSSLFE